MASTSFEPGHEYYLLTTKEHDDLVEAFGEVFTNLETDYFIGMSGNYYVYYPEFGSDLIVMLDDDPFGGDYTAGGYFVYNFSTWLVG